MPKLKFKAFQIDDYARAAMRDGCILAQDTGLGKSLAAMAVPLIKDGVNRVLIVAPESLHLQLRETARNFFGLTLLPLMSQEQFYDWGLENKPESPRDRPLFFLTTYQALGHNGADEWEADKDDDGFPVEVETLRRKRTAFLRAESGWKPADFHPASYFSEGIGMEKQFGHSKVRCVWTPSLARLVHCFDSFDFVVVDEGVRLQSNDAHIATGVRLLSPKHRLVLTATPIKNRLESLFWLAWWAAGGTAEANPRWPYAGTATARETFASEHLLTDKYLTREKEKLVATGKKSAVSRRSARITNLHRLWKIIAPIVLRRRKADCGEEIVPKTTTYHKVPPGTDQLRVYQHYLSASPKRATGLSAAGVQLTLLRQATVAPFTELMKLEGETSPHVLNPKMFAILGIIEDCVKRGEQVMVGSNFKEFGDALHGLLHEAGIWSCLLDGRIDPGKRGRQARDFKDSRYSVMVAGLQAMGEGHSFENCPNLILPSLDWAYDTNAQFVDRVWRMNSTRPVKIHVVATQGSVDEYLWEVFKEKEDSSQLALDGALHAADMDDVSAEVLLERTIKGFDQNAESIAETTLEAQWPALRKKLGAAQKKFANNVNKYQQEITSAA